MLQRTFFCLQRSHALSPGFFGPAAMLSVANMLLLLVRNCFSSHVPQIFKVFGFLCKSSLTLVGL